MSVQGEMSKRSNLLVELTYLALLGVAVAVMAVWIQSNSNYQPNEVLFGATLALPLLGVLAGYFVGQFRGTLASFSVLVLFTLFLRVGFNVVQGVSNVVCGPVFVVVFFFWLFALLEFDGRLVTKFVRTQRNRANARRAAKPKVAKPPKKKVKGGGFLERFGRRNPGVALVTADSDSVADPDNTKPAQSTTEKDVLVLDANYFAAPAPDGSQLNAASGDDELNPVEFQRISEELEEDT